MLRTPTTETRILGSPAAALLASLSAAFFGCSEGNSQEDNAAPCASMCISGEARCAGIGFIYCGHTDERGCLVWSDPQPCPAHSYCASGVCLSQPDACAPDCEGKECGIDGRCNASCGTCDPGCECVNGKCGCCTSTCASTGAECGEVCGKSCGNCPPGQVCTQNRCGCSETQCGTDCCHHGAVCVAKKCCYPDCEGKLCGSDGCSANCGQCESNEYCDTGKCAQLDPICGQGSPVVSVVDDVHLSSDPRVLCSGGQCNNCLSDPNICGTEKAICAGQDCCGTYSGWFTVNGVMIDPQASAFRVEAVYSGGVGWLGSESGVDWSFGAFYSGTISGATSCSFQELATIKASDLPASQTLPSVLPVTITCDKAGVCSLRFQRLRVTSISCAQ